MRPGLCLTAMICLGLLLPRATAEDPAPAPADFPAATLGRLAKDAERITIFRIAQADPVQGTIRWSKVADLKGHEPAATVVHYFKSHTPVSLQRSVFAWAAPGKVAVGIAWESEMRGMCLGNCWYLGAASSPGSWFVTPNCIDNPSLKNRYIGPIDPLIDHLKAILAGEEVVITVPAPARPGLFDDEPTPLVRDPLNGKKGRVCRVRAGLKLIDEQSLAECPGGYFVGWEIGGTEAVPDLVAALASKEARKRAEAAEDLGQIGAAARGAVPALRTALCDEDGIVCVFAAEAMARIDPGNKDALAALLDALKNRRDGVCTPAATALLALGAEGRRGIEPLTAALDKADDTTARSVIAFVLSRLAPEAEIGVRRKAVRALGRALRQDRDAEVRLWAARALVKFGLDGRAALPDLRAALTDQSKDVAKATVNVLSRLGREGSGVLTECLNDHACEVRYTIAEALDNLGPGTPHVVPALKKALEDGNPDIRIWAARLLLRIDHPLGVRLGVLVLARILADPDIGDTNCVYDLLDQLGSEAQAAAPLLIDVLKSNTARKRNLAAYTLGRIGPPAREAVPALIEALDSDDESIRIEAILALGKIGPAARDAMPALRKEMSEAKTESRRVDVAGTLVRLGDTRQLSFLADIATLDGAGERFGALRTLWRMGPIAAAAAPALRAALHNKDDAMRPWMALALYRIGRPIRCGHFMIDQRQEGLELLKEMIRHGEFDLTDLGDVQTDLGDDALALLAAVMAVIRNDRSQGKRREDLNIVDRFGPAAAAVVPDLEAILRGSHDEKERVRIAEVLAHLGRPRLAAPVLLDQLRKPGAWSWSPTFDRLRLLGPEAKSALPMLLQVMRHDNHERYVEAAAALFAIDPQAAAKAGVYDSPMR